MSITSKTPMPRIAQRTVWPNKSTTSGPFSVDDAGDAENSPSRSSCANIAMPATTTAADRDPRGAVTQAGQTPRSCTVPVAAATRMISGMSRLMVSAVIIVIQRQLDRLHEVR